MTIKHYLQRSLKNNLLNWKLQLKSWFRYKTNFNHSGKSTPPIEYELVYEENFDSHGEFEKNWRYAQPWGDFHPKTLWKYWPQTNEVAYLSSDGLVLENRLKPKTFIKSELPIWRQKESLPDEFTINWASGLISSKQSWEHGWFEAEILLPTERGMWSAFWLSGVDSWPPEIDIFEAYTDEDVNNILIRPNIHWGSVEKGTKKVYGAPKFKLKKPNHRYVKYACHWTKDFIKFYYDGHLVQVCNNSKMLKDLSSKQYIIFNNGIKKPKDIYPPIESAMVVRNFKVYQKKV
jgi:hypothetical protein